MGKIKLLLLALGILGVFIAGCDREITGDVVVQTNASENCFACHDGANALGADVVLAVRQWEVSRHASGQTIDRNSGSCRACHISEGFIEVVTGEDIGTTAANAIGCFTCHDPHENGDFELRTTAAVTLGNGAVFNRNEGNLCASCHKSRRDVDTYVEDDTELSGHFGPHHGPQSDMLIGENAYEYAGYSYANSWHTEGVTDGCVKCHFDVGITYQLGGHTFWMASEAEGENTDACNVDGCHVNDTEIDDFDRVTAYDFDDDGDDTEGVATEIEDLMDELQTALIAAGLLEYIADDDAWEPTDGLVVTDADSVGAVFNWVFVHEDRSNGIHNTRYAMGLLRSSINYITTGDPNGLPGHPGDSHPVAMRNGTLSAH